jgi:hypothetical protein
MDNKQSLIFEKICRKFRFPYDCKFIQHRNLKEFRYFMIERINPTHRIFLYGKLKKSYDTNHSPNRILKVGEIWLCYASLVIPIHNAFFLFYMNMITAMMLFHILYYHCIQDNFGVWFKSLLESKATSVQAKPSMQ